MVRAQRAAVLGVGETTIGTVPGKSPTDLQAEAIVNAVRDAGIEDRRNDLGIITLESAAAPVFLASAYLAERLGIQPRFLRSIDLGGLAGCTAMLQDAMWAIESGMVRYVAITFATNGRSRRATGDRGLVLEKPQPGEELAEVVGAAPMVIGYALVAARMIAEGMFTQEALSEIARVSSEHAMRAEQHQRRRPITREDYFSADYISWPLRRYDCSLVSDGGGAVVLGPAADCRYRPVYVEGFAMDSSHASVPNLSRVDKIVASFGTMLETTLAKGRIELADVDLLYVHDAFTPSVAAILAALGKPRGAAMAAWIAAGALDLGGELPTNTHGGLLSQAHIGGILHVVEAVRQLRGGAGIRQVPDAKRALLVGNGGVYATRASALLTTEAA